MWLSVGCPEMRTSMQKCCQQGVAEASPPVMPQGIVKLGLSQLGERVAFLPVCCSVIESACPGKQA